MSIQDLIEKLRGRVIEREKWTTSDLWEIGYTNALADLLNELESESE